MSTYVVLARRWRPRTFDALVGQGHVTRALTHALTTDRVAHAFLFSGIRGVGKTTLARLLAMCLNCEKGISSDPCGVCRSCGEIIAGNHPDVFEIDAASRTKVEQMREVLDMVGYAPASSRCKVYILDEVHMLSTQSFNALLKTLEEPPAHVKFIFATTEPGKIPATILSRCQRYDLKRVPNDVLTAHLVSILEKENTPFDAQGLSEVVRAAEGSVRDALSLLDQVISHGSGAVKFDAVKNLLGLTDQESVLKLLGCMLRGRGPEALQGASDFYTHGVEPESLVKALLEALHQAAKRKLLGTTADESLQEVLDATTGDASLEHLQMVYQVLLRGRQDLRIAEDALQALEMLLLRVAYLKPVPNLEKLMAGLDSGMPPVVPGGTVKSAPSGAWAGGAPPTTSQRVPTPKTEGHVQNPVDSRLHKSGKKAGKEMFEGDGALLGGVADSGQNVDSEPDGFVHPGQRLTSWEQLVSSASRSDMGLGVKLETQLSCLAFHIADASYVAHASRGKIGQTPVLGSPSNIVLQLAMDFLGSPDYFKRLVEEHLTSCGIEGVSVTVNAVSDVPRPKTVSEMKSSLQDDRQKRMLKNIENHSVVKQMVSRFQAQIIRVEPFSDAEAEAGRRMDAH